MSRAIDEILALEEVATCAAVWLEYVQKNGGDYLPEHAQWIHSALDKLMQTRKAATALQKTEETTCACGHEKRQHIYEEGACRPGFVCEKGCDKYEVKKADGESRE